MPTTTTTTTTMTMTTSIDGVTALVRSYELLSSVVAGLDDHDLRKPTNCPDWDVRGLLNHTLGCALMFIGVNRGETLGEDAGDVVGDDAASAVARLASANIESWRPPGALDGERSIRGRPSRRHGGWSSTSGRWRCTRGTSPRRPDNRRSSTPTSPRSSTTSTGRSRWTTCGRVACTGRSSRWRRPLRCRIVCSAS